MTRMQSVLLSIVVLFCLALFTSTPASAAGHPCPVDHGSCFVVDLAGEFFGLSDDGDIDSDGAVFELTAGFQVIAPDCDTHHKFFITAEQVD